MSHARRRFRSPGRIGCGWERKSSRRSVLGYFLSYLLRNINAVIAPSLSAEFLLDAGQLGALTASYFLGFALMQIPIGHCLDRFNPGSVQAALFVVAAGGAALFGFAHSPGELLVARLLVGSWRRRRPRGWSQVHCSLVSERPHPRRQRCVYRGGIARRRRSDRAVRMGPGHRGLAQPVRDAGGHSHNRSAALLAVGAARADPTAFDRHMLGALRGSLARPAALAPCPGLRRQHRQRMGPAGALGEPVACRRRRPRSPPGGGATPGDGVVPVPRRRCPRWCSPFAQAKRRRSVGGAGGSRDALHDVGAASRHAEARVQPRAVVRHRA